VAKFQLCEFLRTPPNEILKSKVEWERGIACVNEFNDTDVAFIIDEAGKKLGRIHRYRLINVLAFGAIDTEVPGGIYI
jgi:hypothetical protein